MASITSSYSSFQNKIKEQILSSTSIAPDTVELILDYLKIEGTFGRAEWLKYCNVDPGPEPNLTQEFYDFWYGPDPIDTTRQVCETHIPPIFRPRFLTHFKIRLLMAASLRTLSLFQLQYSLNEEAFLANENKKAGPGCWLVMRRGVLERGESYDSQRAFMKCLNKAQGTIYEEMPSVVDLAFVVFARCIFKGEYHLGDPVGEEREWTYSRCEETFEKEAYKYNEQKKYEYPLIVGGFSNGKLHITHNCLYSYMSPGVAALCKF